MSKKWIYVILTIISLIVFLIILFTKPSFWPFMISAGATIFFAGGAKKYGEI